MNLNIQKLREKYLKKELSVEEIISSIKEKIEQTKDYNIWIYTLSDEQLSPYLENLKTKI